MAEKYQFKATDLQTAENAAKIQSKTLKKRLYVIQNGRFFIVDENSFIRAYEKLQAVYDNGVRVDLEDSGT